MFNPEVTLRIIRHSRSSEPSRWHWGVKAVERRIDRCCDDNPDCERAIECFDEYVQFVNGTDNPKHIYDDDCRKVYRSIIEPCTLHGIKLNEDFVRY